MFGSSAEDKALIVKELQSYPCCQRCMLRYLGSRIPSQYKANNPSEIINKILHKATSQENAVLPNKEPLPSGGTNAQTDNSEVPSSVAPSGGTIAKTDNGEEPSSVAPSGGTTAKTDNGEEPSNVQPPDETVASNVAKTDNGEVSGDAIEVDECVCISCLGTLQDKYSSLFVSKVVEAVREADHKFESFQMSVSLSSQFILRQHAIWKHLQTSYRSVYSSHKLDELCSIKDVLKWVYGPKLSSPLDVRFSPMSQFEIGLLINHSATSRECDFLIPCGKSSEPPSRKRRKIKNYEGVPRTVVHKQLSEMSAEELKKRYPWPPSTPIEACTVTVTTTYAPIFVAGRYNKYSRTLSQTPWLIDGQRKTAYSVEEYICEPIKEGLQAKDYKFSSSGREDVDVRTLGRGRPFLVEVVDPHRALQSQEEMSKLQELINSRTKDVAVNDLQIVTKEETKMLKEGEMAKTKSYKAKIWIEEAKTQEDLKILETYKDLTLYQKTPIRVLHRRNLATRERVIHSMHAEYIDDHHFQLNLRTQAGTYIKEFVHSDFGRTEPNLGALLKCHVDILELDVASVDLDWPKNVDAATNKDKTSP